MAKSNRSAPPASASDSQPFSREFPPHAAARIQLCQRVLHGLTGVMIGAFVAILVLTTISSGPFVQDVGRSLYFVILASAVVSLVAWVVRLRIEKRGGREGRALQDLSGRS